MPTAAMLMLQLASTIGPSPAAADAAKGSLLHPVPTRGCAAKAGEIVVCGNDKEPYRLPGASGQPDVTGPPKAEWKVFGNATAGVGTSQRNVGGYPSNAVMATIKIPF